MSNVANEEMKKSIDTLLDEVFSEEVSKSSALDIASDSSTTADAAVNKAPAMQKDDARGAGRPKQISDVPQTDTDGRRDSQYDAAIAAKQAEEENEEAKKQAKAIDQTSSAGHSASSSAAPKTAPFMKSVSEAEYAEFEEFKKSKAAAAEKAKEAEVLRKSEDLVKSEIAKATAKLTSENEALKKSVSETNALIKAMAAQPRQSKSITGIDVLEKSSAPQEKGEESFTKSEVLDAAFELAKAGKIPAEAVSEIEMTGRCNDAGVRAKIEKQLEKK